MTGILGAGIFNCSGIAVRIIAGTLGGRRLNTVSGEGFRPAMGRTREALFSMLTARGIDWQTTRALDIFAGSGSLAFEALSRGAPRALFVENALHAVRCLRGNVAALGVHAQTRIVCENALHFLKRPSTGTFNLVFLDPPYGKNLLAPSLTALLENAWLAPGAFVTAEIEKEAAFEPPAPLTLSAERFFGRTRICIWTSP
jgi:16S rRNA (guanine966-N2)-methyltransferase